MGTDNNDIDDLIGATLALEDSPNNTPSEIPAKEDTENITQENEPSNNIIDVKESNPADLNHRFKLKKWVWIILILCLFGGFIYSAVMLREGDERVLEVKTDNFYYIYSIEEDDTATLMIPAVKIPDRLKDEIELEDGSDIAEENQLLVVPGVKFSQQALDNAIIHDGYTSIYGIDNVYVYETGYGIFRHKVEKTQDILYLTHNMAIRLGLEEGTIEYDYVMEDGSILTQEEYEEYLKEKALEDQNSGATVEETTEESKEAEEVNN